MGMCDVTGRETEFEEQEEGVLVCPECGERLDAESLEILTQPHSHGSNDLPSGGVPLKRRV